MVTAKESSLPDRLTSPSSFHGLFSATPYAEYVTMSPPITSEKITLTYPIYGAAFIDGGYLVVGGGGGEGRSGVGNKIVRGPFIETGHLFAFFFSEI